MVQKRKTKRLRYAIQRNHGICYTDTSYRFVDGREQEAIDKAHSLGGDYRVVDTWEGKIIWPK